MRGIGLVGCGYITTLLRQGLRDAGGNLVATCDLNEENGKQVAAEFGAKYYKDYDEFLANKEIEAVIIAVPNYLHFQFASKAVEAGKMVFCEKPMTTNINDSLELVKLVQTHGKLFQVGYMKRFHPAFGQIKSKLASVGPILGATIKLFMATSARPDGKVDASKATWHSIPEKSGGGFLVHSASHSLDLMLYTFGIPKQLWGNVILDKAGNDYNINSFFLMPEGYFVHLQMAIVLVPRVGYQNTFWEETVEVIADKAIIRAEGSDWQGMLAPRLSIREHGKETSEIIQENAMSQWSGEFNAFLDGIAKNQCLGSSVIDGYRVDQIIDTMKTLTADQKIIDLNFLY